MYSSKSVGPRMVPQGTPALVQLKALAILSITTVRRSAVYRGDLEPYWKSEKKATFL